MTADGSRRISAKPLRIWDISPAVDQRAEVFPDDAPYSQQLHFSLSPDCSVNVNRITLSPHTGAHADAPLHYAVGAAAIGELDLAPYLGPCRVIPCLDCGPLVLPDHIAHALDGLPGRDWTQGYVTSDAVEMAWLTVYRDPKHYWDLYQQGEELTDLEEAFRL